MATPYSLDLRERIMKDYDGGYPIDDLVVHYEVSRSWLYSLLKQRRESGSIAPRIYRPGKKKKLSAHEQTVRQVVAAHHDATLVDFCADLSKQNIVVSTTTLCNFLKYLKITRKKKTLCASERLRPDVVLEREAWKKLQEAIDFKQFVFLDETWAKTNMTPLYGWAQIGKRVLDDVPQGHWKTTTFGGVAVRWFDGTVGGGWGDQWRSVFGASRSY